MGNNVFPVVNVLREKIHITLIGFHLLKTEHVTSYFPSALLRGTELLLSCPPVLFTA